MDSDEQNPGAATIAGAHIDESARDRIVVSGSDARSYLHSQVAQDVEALEVGETRWTFVLEPAGKVVALARITRSADDRFLIDTDAGYGRVLVDRLERFKIRVDAQIELQEAAAGSDPSPSSESARVALGWPRMGTEIVPGETIPGVTGVTDLAVSYTKGCYPGQELVERMDARGAQPPRSLRIVDVGSDASAGDPVLDADGQQVGELTTIAGSTALAYISRGADTGRPPPHNP
jgi:folate-binding protein YgfZ